MKRFFLLQFLTVVSISSLLAETPDWVRSYGVSSSYNPAQFLTGFAMVDTNESDYQELAIEKALVDMSKKIKVQIQSQLIIQEEGNEDGYHSAISSITKSSVDATISGADFHIHKDGKNCYVLAYISISELQEQYITEASVLWNDIMTIRQNAEVLLNKKRSNDALRQLYISKKLFTELYEKWSLYKAIKSSASEESFFLILKNAETLSDLKQIEQEIIKLTDMADNGEASTLSEGLGKMAVILALQDVPGGQIQVPPFLYEATSFSSEFGRYAGNRLESYLVKELSSESNKDVVIKGQYWEEGDKLRLILLAVDEKGGKLGRAEVRIPIFERSGKDLKPQNFNQAMVALREFADGAITDGGINIDVWTNKGNDEDSQVFSAGDTLQLYFRVNQPAFLQLTYKLATGELVLLEKSFYIGMDKVNQAVALPYEFEVQPPFGVEQLIVTAYSSEPPAVTTIPKYIEGEVYDVFSTVSDVVVNTRGLGRKKPENANMRVGETILSMTMLGKE